MTLQNNTLHTFIIKLFYSGQILHFYIARGILGRQNVTSHQCQKLMKILPKLPNGDDSVFIKEKQSCFMDTKQEYKHEEHIEGTGRNILLTM